MCENVEKTGRLADRQSACMEFIVHGSNIIWQMTVDINKMCFSRVIGYSKPLH